MSRIGFDEKRHPYRLQLRLCTFPDPEEIRSRCAVTIDFREGKITNYNTDESFTIISELRRVLRTELV